MSKGHAHTPHLSPVSDEDDISHYSTARVPERDPSNDVFLSDSRMAASESGELSLQEEAV